MSWRLVYTRAAQKDARGLAAAGLRDRAQDLLELLADDPFRSPPPFEKLVGDLAGAHSRRINIQHRLVYQVLPQERIVKVLRMWSHYRAGTRRSRATALLPSRHDRMASTSGWTAGCAQRLSGTLPGLRPSGLRAPHRHLRLAHGRGPCRAARLALPGLAPRAAPGATRRAGGRPSGAARARWRAVAGAARRPLLERQCPKGLEPAAALSMATTT